MKLYTVQTNPELEGTLVIARSGAHAAEIFVTYRAAEHGAPPEAFTLYPNQLPQIGALGDLLRLIDAGESGVVHFGEDGDFTLTAM